MGELEKKLSFNRYYTKCPLIKKMGEKDDWDFRISDLVKTLMELIFNPCGEFS